MKKTVGIIGLGLMGGSFARLLIKNGYTVLGCDRDPFAVLKAGLMKAISGELTQKNAKLVDTLIIAVPPSKFSVAAENFLPFLKNGAVITDFCGVKRPIVSKMKEYAREYPELVFIGGHPMAGREFSGIEHSSVNLFERASMILTPVNADIFQVEQAKAFYLSLGFGKVVITDAENHDRIIAYTSQLCHVVSNAFIKNGTAEDRSGYSAGSFRDLTRVARMDPAMWTELVLFNKDNLIKELDELIGNLNKFRGAVDGGDKEKLYALFSEGNERKLFIESIGGKNERT